MRTSRTQHCDEGASNSDDLLGIPNHGIDRTCQPVRGNYDPIQCCHADEYGHDAILITIDRQICPFWINLRRLSGLLPVVSGATSLIVDRKPSKRCLSACHQRNGNQRTDAGGPVIWVMVEVPFICIEGGHNSRSKSL